MYGLQGRLRPRCSSYVWLGSCPSWRCGQWAVGGRQDTRQLLLHNGMPTHACTLVTCAGWTGPFIHFAGRAGLGHLYIFAGWAGMGLLYILQARLKWAIYTFSWSDWNGPFIHFAGRAGLGHLYILQVELDRGWKIVNYVGLSWAWDQHLWAWAGICSGCNTILIIYLVIFKLNFLNVKFL